MWWFRVRRWSDGRRRRDDEGFLDHGDARNASGRRHRVRDPERRTERARVRDLRFDDAPDQLPVENGSIPADRIDLVDETEDIAPGTNTSLSVNLEPGSYVLVCNLPTHYEAGMYAALAVA